MQNGNVNEFVNHIYFGDELIFRFHGEKYFLQGMYEDRVCKLFLDRWEPPANDYIWTADGSASVYPVEEFLKARLWDDKTFWEAENEMEWLE